MPFGDWNADSAANSAMVQNMYRYGNMSGPPPPMTDEEKAHQLAQQYAFKQQYDADTKPQSVDEKLLDTNSDLYHSVPDIPRAPQEGEVSVAGGGMGKAWFQPTRQELTPEGQVGLNNLMANNQSKHTSANTAGLDWLSKQPEDVQQKMRDNMVANGGSVAGVRLNAPRLSPEKIARIHAVMTGKRMEGNALSGINADAASKDMQDQVNAIIAEADTQTAGGAPATPAATGGNEPPAVSVAPPSPEAQKAMIEDYYKHYKGTQSRETIAKALAAKNWPALNNGTR